MAEERGFSHVPRKSERAATNVVIEIYNPEGKILRGICRLLDLSITGACVESTTDLLEGDRFVLRLLLEGKNRLLIPVAVVWKKFFHRTFHYGLKFGEYPDIDRDAIEAFVKTFAAKLKKMAPKYIYIDPGGST